MKEKTKTKISVGLIIFITVLVLAAGILLLTGVFQPDHDYKTFKGEKYSDDLSKLVMSTALWNNTCIEYKQMYTDGQIIENMTVESGVGRKDYRMYHEYHVTGMGDVSEFSWYKDEKLVKERVSGEKSSVVVTTLSTESEFALLKQEYSGNYKSYLAAFKADVFSSMQIKKQDGVVTYKVDFDDETTRMIMGRSSSRLQLLLVYENGQVSMLRFMYDKVADKSVADDCDSSVVLTFTNTQKPITWHEEFDA